LYDDHTYCYSCETFKWNDDYKQQDKNVYKMETVLEQNKKNDWWGWKITLEKSINDLKNPSYIVGEAQNFHELVSSGSIDPAPEAMVDVEEIVQVKPQAAHSEVLG